MFLRRAAPGSNGDSANQNGTDLLVGMTKPLRTGLQYEVQTGKYVDGEVVEEIFIEERG